MVNYDLQKELSRITYEAKKCSRVSECCLCGKSLEGSVNSHSLPLFVLKHIAKGGQVFSPMLLVSEKRFGQQHVKGNQFGLNNAGTFRMLCKECDKKWFSDYEKPEFWDEVADCGVARLNDRILAEIYLKSALYNKWKKCVSGNTSLEPCVRFRDIDPYYRLYAQDLQKDITTLKDAIGGNRRDVFEVVYFEVLDHQSNFASQALISLRENVDGSIVNDYLSLDSSYRIAHLQTVLFPVRGKTVCIAYCFKTDSERYQNLKSYFDSLKPTAKRKLFQSILMLYSEDIFTNVDGIQAVRKDQKTAFFLENEDYAPSKNLSGFRKCHQLF